MVGEDAEGDVLRHAAGEIGIDEAHQRHVGQGGIVEQGVDAGADRNDEPEVGERAQQPRRRLPHERGVDVLDAPQFRRHPHVEARIERTDVRGELLGARAAGNE